MAQLTFSVDSALLSELGEKLVETPHIALVELVKNAYDADATNVVVKIIPHPNKGPEIHVVDDGVGMTLDEVKKYWMRIATTHKVNSSRSFRYGRPRTGSKGIGRFSCRRLGTRLRILTTAKKTSRSLEETNLFIDWTQFRPGREISTITCHGTSKSSQNTVTGTTLIISGHSTDEWGKRGYDYLKRQLAVLSANRGRRRPGFEEDPGFTISLEAPDFNETISNLRDRLLVAGWGELELRVSANGEVTCKLNAMRIGSKSITHPRRFPLLAGVSARIGIMVLDRYAMRDREVISKGSLSEIISNWGGVYIRYRGFRVYPYGEPGNDWLNIDRDRGLRKTALSELLQPFALRLRGVNPHRAGLSLLSSKSYIGDVDIGDAATGFQLKASREGFVGDDHINALRDVVRFAIDWSTMYREYAKNIEAKESARKAREELTLELRQPIPSRELVQTALDVITNEVQLVAKRLPTPDRQDVLRSLRTATRAIATHETSNREELRHLQLVASTSTLLLIFSHEVKSLLGWLEQVSITLARLARTLGDQDSRKLSDIRQQFTASKKRFVDLLSMTSLISISSRDAKPARLALRHRLEEALRCFDLVVKSYLISIDVDRVPTSLLVGPMLEAELYSVFLNVVSNSVKSVIAAGDSRRIAISAEREGSHVKVHVRDTGLGLKQQSFDQVFTPFVADPDGRLYRGLKSRLNPEDQYIVGTGSGLGLGIAKEIVMFRGGDMRFLPPTGEWKTDLEITLP